jgi:hypothetical protein
MDHPKLDRVETIAVMNRRHFVHTGEGGGRKDEISLLSFTDEEGPIECGVWVDIPTGCKLIQMDWFTEGDILISTCSWGWGMDDSTFWELYLEMRKTVFTLSQGSFY